jgi:NADH-quinone oxidoreductase subunit K
VSGDLPVPFLLGVAGVLFGTGLACLGSRRNLLRMILGLEFLGKAACLVFVVGGRIHGDPGGSQAMVLNVIVIEAAVTAVALALVILARRHLGASDAASLAARGGEGKP